MLAVGGGGGREGGWGGVGVKDGRGRREGMRGGFRCVFFFFLNPIPNPPTPAKKQLLFQLKAK